MTFICQIIFASAATVCFASFVWAIKKHFVQAGRMPAGMRLVSAASLSAFLLQMFAVAHVETINYFLAAAGLTLYAASFWLFWWAIRATRQRRLTLAFSADEPRHLQTAGPYRYVRHPFYSSYLLFWTAGLLATGEWFLLFVVVAMFALYARAARLEEDKFARSALSENYLNYRTATGMFLPKIVFWTILKKQSLTANDKR